MHELRQAHRLEWVKEEYPPDTVRGNIMTEQELQEHYNDQLEGLRGSVEFLNEGMPPGIKKTLNEILETFRADLSFLRTKGINIEEAETLLTQWGSK